MTYPLAGWKYPIVNGNFSTDLSSWGTAVSGASASITWWNSGRSGGSLNISDFAKESTTANITQSFSYLGNSTPFANLTFAYWASTATKSAAGSEWAIYLTKPDGTKTKLWSTALPTATGGVPWTTVNLSLGNNISKVGTYTLDLSVNYVNPASGYNLNVSYDDVKISINSTNVYVMNIQNTFSDVPSADNYYLQANYSVVNDTFSVWIFNGTTWNNRTVLDATSFTLLNLSLTADEYNSGAPQINIKDNENNVTKQGKLYLDYLKIYGWTDNTTHYELDVRHNLTEISTEKNTDYYFVIRGYKGSGDNVDIKMWDYDAGNWRTYGISKFKATTDWYNVSIASTSIDSAGKASIRYVDSNQSRYDNVQDSVYVDYSGIRSETYEFLPCRYCHAINKHAADAMGNVHNVKGSNKLNTTDFANSTWCANCHHNVSNPGYNVTGLTPVPPLITIDNTGKAGWYDHSGDIASGYNDSVCNSCHGNSSTNSKQNVHDITVGKGGGVNCTSCHNVDGSAKKVNFTSINKSMHANLNKNATGNATNKPCWGCHGTKNGSYANESDQPASGHNDTYKTSARKCHECHNSSSPQFNAKPVTDHIPYGVSPSTDVNTSKYNKTYCVYCHNNSVGASLDPDGLGSNPMNASSAHYGANRTANKLMSATNNTTDCIYCHRNNSNMLKWGILSGSLSNISNKNGTAGAGYNHTPYAQSSQCYDCHGGTVANFHVSAMSPGEKGNPNCASCHNVSSPGSYAKVDFVAINLSIHGSLNNKSSASAGNETNKPCWGCHGTKNGSYANQSDQPANDHNSTYKSLPRKCEDCHINGTIQFNAPGLTEHIMPGKNASTEINVTEGYCTVCHNNSITSNSDNDGIGIFSVINASTAHYAKDANANLMTTAYHSDNCTYCHFINNGSSAWLTPKKPLTSTHTSYSNATTASTCWGCHVDFPGEPSTFHVQAINKGAGSGPNCRSCHNTSDNTDNRGHIDGNVFNTSIHGSMNTTGGVDLNEPCWGCHGNGSSEGHNDTGDAYGKGKYKNPYNCTDCHISGGIRNAWAVAKGALNVSEHYRNGSDIKATNATNNIRSCLACHQNISEMRLYNNDPDEGTFDADGDGVNGTNISAYHYGRKRTDLRSGTSTNCTYCHQDASSVFPMTDTNKSIREHTTNNTANITNPTLICTGCHATGFIHNASLRKNTTQVWTTGKQDYCAPCHKINDTNATKYVYSHNTTATPIGDDCGYCHNASSQGINGSKVRVHTLTLTNTTGTVIYGNCTGCHNGTSLYVGAAKQILSHMPNASRYRGNTSNSSYDCKYCHNLSGKPSMHSAGMNRSNGTCDTCHFSFYHAKDWKNQITARTAPATPATSAGQVRSKPLRRL